MKRCAFLTLRDPTGFVIDDDLAYAPLRDLGWRIDAVPWDQLRGDWRAYDAVVIRSTWDYASSPDQFLATLSRIEEANVPLFNDLETVRWNLDKTYLRDLESRGVPIVPTTWRDGLERGELAALFAELGTEEMVVKPVVGAGATGAFRLDRRRLTSKRASEVEAYFAGRPLMVQPFLPVVVSEGEYSLFYFRGELSHAILKTPLPRDFRVQEEHGGEIKPVAADRDLCDAAERALEALDHPLLYARVDLVRAPGAFWLMELELIEPSLYLRMDAEAPTRFAHALDLQVRSAQ